MMDIYSSHNVTEQSYWTRLVVKLRTIGAHSQPALRSQHTLTRPSLTVGNPSPFLRERLQEDSNHELEWLWAASQVSTAEETRYCLERALYINPDNRDTQRALSIF